jgi:hypothetical protein
LRTKAKLRNNDKKIKSLTDEAFSQDTAWPHDNKKEVTTSDISSPNLVKMILSNNMDPAVYCTHLERRMKNSTEPCIGETQQISEEAHGIDHQFINLGSEKSQFINTKLWSFGMNNPKLLRKNGKAIWPLRLKFIQLYYNWCMKKLVKNCHYLQK